jgi:hypothetical protein
VVQATTSRPVLRASIDDFHRPGHKFRSMREEWTPQSYYDEGYDYLAFRKQLHRGHSVAAASLLARLRTHCASLLALARAQDLNFDREVLNERLAATVDSVDPARSPRAMAGLHQEIGSAIAAHFGVDYPLEVAQLLSRG